MSRFIKDGHEWEHLYTQFKNASKDQVLCMVNKRTKKLVYFDVTLNKMLSKQEALHFRADVTGVHVTYKEKRAAA
jgi:adenylate cyclase class IV